MKKEYLVLFLVIIIILVVGFSLFFIFKNKQLNNQNLENVQIPTITQPISNEILLNEIQTSSIEILQTTDSLQISTSQLPISTTQETKNNFYTIEEVSKHNSKESCWTVIRGEVYDLTQWIDKHPGGADKILSICGKDGTQAFVRKHGGKEKPEKILKEFEIGILKTQ